MRRSIMVIVGVVIAALALAACSSPAPQRLGGAFAAGKPLPAPKVSASQAAVNKLESYTQYDPTTEVKLYNYTLKAQAWWWYKAVAGLNPQLPQLAQLAKTIPAPAVWRQIAGVYTIIGTGSNVGIEICEQGAPSGPAWPRITNFVPGVTTGPAIPKGTPVVEQKVINGKKVLMSVPSPGGQHQPGPFFPILYEYGFTHNHWTRLTFNAARFSCENHM